MIQNFLNGQFNSTTHLSIFKQLLKCCLGVSLLVYAGIRLIFFDVPFNLLEESILIGKMLLTGALFATAISVILLTADAIQYVARKGRMLQPVFVVKRLALAMLLLILIAGASYAQTNATGTVKDKGTGLTATYNTIKPTKVMLVMNNEVLGHTDIPIGESFQLVNNGIKGLVVKAGKVSVGCSLVIKDKKGKVMLKNEDLFKGKDIFAKNDTDYLRCTIATGDPMKWEEKYDVTVVFWDKYGIGKIENKVTVRCIDIP